MQFPKRECKYLHIGLTQMQRTILFFLFLTFILIQVILVLYLENKMAEVDDIEQQIKSSATPIFNVNKTIQIE